LILEAFSVLDKKTDDNHDELKEEISLVNVKISALTKRIDAVDENLTKRIDAVHSELVAHRKSVELHKAPGRRVLKQL
jgi:peptidoglycan hydrolase CwlO-like protein